MIQSFRDKEAEKLFHREPSRKLPSSIQRIAMRKLWMIDAAVQLSDLKIPPGNRLEPLSGNRKGQHSIRVNKQWRICFTWRNNNAYNIEITDYHK